MNHNIFPLLAAVALLAATARADTPSFTLDVVPILSKAGCNTGGCHGALAGKGGFRLSLFGYDPQADHLAISREALGRRVDTTDPGASLLLTKPTMAVAHKGGLRLDASGPDYALLAAWISAGCPGPSIGPRPGPPAAVPGPPRRRGGGARSSSPGLSGDPEIGRLRTARVRGGPGGRSTGQWAR